jgi:hypothetical protein
MPQAATETSNDIALEHAPGCLMAPFGWAAKPLAALVESDRSLYSALFTLSRRRMHLIALVLAHWQGAIEAPFARLVMVGALPIVADAVLGRRPAGLRRALSRIPPKVLLRASYRQLIELLEEPATAALIYSAGTLRGSPAPAALHTRPALHTRRIRGDGRR